MMSEGPRCIPACVPVKQLVNQQAQLVLDPLSDRQSVQLLKSWSHTFVWFEIQNGVCCRVQDSFERWKLEDRPRHIVTVCISVPYKNSYLVTHLFIDSLTADINSQWRESWKSASVVNAHLVDDPTIRQPGFALPQQQWSLLNRFRTGQGHCGACKIK